jgi:hypothetical protein
LAADDLISAAEQVRSRRFSAQPMGKLNCPFQKAVDLAILGSNADLLRSTTRLWRWRYRFVALALPFFVVFFMFPRQKRTKCVFDECLAVSNKDMFLKG